MELLHTQDVLQLVRNINPNLQIEYDESQISQFIQNFLPDSLLWLVSDKLVLHQDLESLQLSDDSKLAITIKQRGQVCSANHISVLVIPLNSEHYEVFDKIRSIVNLGLLPIFETVSFNNNDSFVNVTRKRFNELSASLKNLQEKIQVPDLLVSVHPLIKEMGEVIPDEIFKDTNVLNEVTSIVNGWIKQIQSVTTLTTDVNTQTSISEEIQFWTSLDISLTAIESQINSPQVKTSIELLNRAKRFHVTLSFNNDTNLSNKSLETKLNLSLLKELPINDLININPKDPECLIKFQDSISNIFNHLKRLRTISFPLDKGLMIIELCLKDIEQKFIEILTSLNLFSLDLNEFLRVNDTEILNVLNNIDLNVKYMINLIRELLRKRHEKFILVRINQDNINSIQLRLDNLRRFRLKHENLLFIIRNFLKNVDQETQILEAYNRLSLISPFDLSKYGQVSWTNNENMYETVYTNIQNSITLQLNNLFANCEQINDYISVADKYKYLTVEGTFDISILMKEDLRMKILETAKSEVSSIIKFDSQHGDKVIENLTKYINNYESGANEDIKAMAIRSLSIRDKLNFYENSIESLVGIDWYKYSIGNRLKEQIDTFTKKMDLELIFTNFLDDLVTYTTTKKVEAKGKIIRKTQTSDVVLNFDKTLLHYKSTMMFFVNLGFKVPTNILLEFSYIDKLIPLIQDLDSNLMIIKHIFHQRLIKFDFLVESDKQEVYKIFQKLSTVHWEYLSQAIDMENIDNNNESNLIEIQSFKTVLEFSRIVERFNNKLNIISKLNSFLSSQYHQLKSCEYDTNSIQTVLANMRSKVFDIYTFDNLKSVCDFIDKEIINILSSRIENELKLLVKTLKDGSKQKAISIEILGKDQKIFMEPSTEEIRGDLVQEINSLLEVTESQTLLEYGICYIEPKVSIPLADAVEEVDVFVTKITNYYNSWKQIELLINLDVDSDIDNFVTDSSLKSWYFSMNQVLTLRSNFYKPIESIGRGTIYLENVQSLIASKFDNFQRTIIQLFAQKYQEQVRSLEEELKSAMSEMNFNTMESSKLISHLTSYIRVKSHLENQWKEAHDDINESSALFPKFQFKYPSNWMFVDQIDIDISSLWTIVQKKQEIINDNFELVKSRLIGQTDELSEAILSFKDEWYSKRPISGDMNPQMVLNFLDKFEISCSNYIETKTNLNSISKFFGIEIPEVDITILNDIFGEINDFKQVWNSIHSLKDQIQTFRAMKWIEVKPRDIRIKLEHLLEECRLVPIKVRQYAAFDEIQQKAKDLMKQHKYLVDLKNENLKERHWKTFFQTIGYQGKSYQLFTLGDIWNLNLTLHETAIKAMMSQANNEHILEESIHHIKESWNHITFEFFNFNPKLKLIKSWDGLFEKCTQDLSELSSMSNSSCYGSFEQEITIQTNKLNSFYILLDIWIEVQRQFVYLEGMFESNNNISGFLPVEASRFNNLSFEFLELMKKVYKIELAIDVLSIIDIEITLDKFLDSFARLKRSLTDFLEKQRQSFARFYFIGNEDLLELIGSGTDFNKINSHIDKIFPAISSVQYDSNSSNVVSIESSEGEIVELLQPISLIKYPSLLQWLSKLELEIKLTIAQSIKSNINPIRDLYELPNQEKLEKIINTVPNQVITVCTQIVCTEFHSSHKQIDFQMVIDILGDYIFNSSSLLRKKAQNLLVELLYQSQPKNLDIELSYHFVDTEDLLTSLKVKSFNYSFDYGFEYLGVPTKLVYTPLITKCFATMTQTLGQKLGGSPFGPAGTGKTESIKALGENLGRTVIIFCCDETFDFQAMCRIFLGLCRVGCWGCFDEFNRLDEELLSAVSSQIETIELGLKTNKKIEISGNSFKINPNTGLFVTMNPGYVGRNELPENLKKLFRNFSMEKPDKEIIVDVLLSSQGFKSSASLSQLIVPFYEQLESDCSNQIHYDFGLRALKSMLNNCGKLKRKIKVEELIIILKSIYETVLPKLTRNDETQFHKLVNRYFPGISLDEFDDEKLLQALDSVCQQKHLSFDGIWKQKVLQLHQLQTHHGIMLVGESGSGKTSCRNILSESLERITGIEHVQYVIDAKVMNKGILYGTLDSITREWTDGLFTHILRRIKSNLRGEKNKVSWIVFDGDIDPEWAENLNSVLDDNKILTLPNGERLEVPENVRIIFETDNLLTTTPATISRCGMIWFEKDILSTKDIFLTISQELYSINQTFAQTCREIIVPKLDEIIDQSKKLDHIMDFNIHRYLNSLTVFLKSYCRDNSDMEYIKKAIVLSIVWTFSGDCPFEQRESFSIIISKYVDIDVENILEYNIETNQYWKVPFIELEPHKVSEPNIVIPTTDTIRHEHLIQSILNQHNTLLLCGPPGSGKTMTFLEVLKKSPQLDVMQLNFSKESSPESLMKCLKQHCEYQKTSKGIVFTPKTNGKWVVVFCDEINLPGTDKYGCQTVISLMRQMIEYKGFWDKSQWVSIKNIQFVGACNSPKDPGRHKLTERFLRHITLIMVDYPGNKSLHQIYETFNSGVMKCAPQLKGYVKSITNAMIDIYTQSKSYLSQLQPHYIYSPRELTRWTRGLLEALKTTEYKDLETFVRLWYHEGLRLFYDRLVSEDHKIWTQDLFKSVVSSHFPFKQLDVIMREPVLFSDWLSSDYESINKAELYKFLSHRFTTFSEEEIDVKLVLYEDLLVHALQIDRVLRQPQGHMILVGSPTSGKTTLTKFVAWMNGLNTVQLQVHSNYDIGEFDKQLREILIRCVREQICYIIDESSIMEASFIERMNTLLANSEVPGLFEGDEYKNLMNLCLEESQAQGLFLDSESELYTWFSKQISTNLHVVFTLTGLQETVISSPALFNRCVLSYMGDWSTNTLQEVGLKYIQDLPLDPRLAQTLVESLIYIHKSVSSYPGKFVSLIQQFIEMFNSKQFEMEENQRHTTTGLNKLRETVLEVAKLKEDLSTKQESLAKKDSEARQMLNTMLAEQNEAERKQEFSITAQEELNKQEIEIDARKKLVMKDLESATPAILEARKGVQNIKKQHLTEIRSMGNPPSAVKITMESVCILLGYEVTNWKDVQLAIRGEEFIPNIVNYSNEEQLTKDIRQYMEQTYLSRPDFTFETVNRASKACGPLLLWVRAQLLYSSVLESIGPLREEVEILENGARKTKAQLNALKQMVKELEVSIEKYKEDYSSLIRDAENIKIEMKSVESKVEKSVKLIESLTTEKDRWKQTIQRFNDTNQKIIGNSLLETSFLVYCGEFDQKTREALLKEWRQNLELKGVQFDALLDNDLTKGNNLIIASSKVPLIIDPNSEITQKLSITSFLNDSFTRDLENAIRFGGLIMVQDTEYYNPILDSILRNQTYRNGGRIMISIGHHLIDYDPKFKLCLHTRDSSIQLTSFVKSRVSIVNFSITSQNLESQILNLALKITRPDIETKRNGLIKLQSEYKAKLKDLEVTLLESISEVHSILDDDKVIENLEHLKYESSVIDTQMKESEVILDTIDEVRNKFYDVSKHSSSIFDILQSLAKLHGFYRFSVSDYTTIFSQVLTNHKDLVLDLYKEVYSIISPSLSMDHKIVFAVQLACSYYNQELVCFQEFFTKMIDIIRDQSYSELGSLFEILLIKDVTVDNLHQKIDEEKDNEILKKLQPLLMCMKQEEIDWNIFSKGLIELTSFLFDGGAEYKSKYDLDKFIESPKPIILASSKGFDATFKVEQLALTKGKTLGIVSLGSKEGIESVKQELQGNSDWLLIQNIQMSFESLNKFEKQIKNHPKKIFLTTNLDSKIPTTLIEDSQILVYESQPSFRSSLLEMFQYAMSSVPSTVPEKTQLYFLLSWYHCMILERLKYTPTSFTKNYDINETDFQAGINAIDNILQPLIKNNSNLAPSSIPWKTISLVIGELVYGGKIDNSMDLQYFIKLSDRLFCIESFESGFMLAEGVILPEGISYEVYEKWISDLDNEVPLKWIDLDESVRDELMGREFRGIVQSLQT